MSAATHQTSDPTLPKAIWSWREDAAVQRICDNVPIESPLEVRFGGRVALETTRTPGHDTELALGYLFAAGLITSADEVASVGHSTATRPNVVEVSASARWSGPETPVGASVEEICRRWGPIETHLLVDASRLLGLVEGLATGPIHTAAVLDERGALVALREDLRRVNAVDKLIGAALLESSLPYDRHVLLVSGRASFEIVRKALAARMPIVASTAPPSSRACELAVRGRMSLIRLVGETQLGVYTGPERFRFGERHVAPPAPGS